MCQRQHAGLRIAAATRLGAAAVAVVSAVVAVVEAVAVEAAVSAVGGDRLSYFFIMIF